MATKDELLKTINDSFAELAKDFDNESLEYDILYDPTGPPQVNDVKPGYRSIRVFFEKVK